MIKDWKRLLNLILHIFIVKFIQEEGCLGVFRLLNPENPVKTKFGA